MAKNRLDKYYTPKDIVDKTLDIARNYFPIISEVVEPMAGDGAFIEGIKELCRERNATYRFYDIEPEHPEIIKQDFKELKLGYKPDRIFISNPAFGNASSLFKRAVKGACEMGDGAVYVGPASHWNAKWGWKGLRLVYSEHLGDVEYYTSEGNGESKRVNTCLNVYMRGEAEKDDRMERLERDVEIQNLKRYADGTMRETHWAEYEYYVCSWGSSVWEYDREPKYAITFGIKILNEDRRKDIEDFLKGAKERYDIKSAGSPNITMGDFKQKLAEYLYPTREERLSRDVEIWSHRGYKGDKKYGHFIGQIGDGCSCRYTNDPYKWAAVNEVIILNKDREDEIIYFLKNLREREYGELKNKKSSATAVCSVGFLKEKLAEYLYPEDE